MAQQSERPLPKFRRIVTTHDATGKPVILVDGDATNHKFPDAKMSSTLMWSTDATPTGISGNEDEGARILGSAPPFGGSRFTMMVFQPGNQVHGVHRTDTVDYVICVAGEIDMFLDESEFVTLRAGDVLIQRGTYHAWVNRSAKPCQLAVVLVDALPKREGSISGLVSAR
jgi:oxalate decarboxylase/phosphoglucose isomerase-like protein (cupin superfamily)